MNEFQRAFHFTEQDLEFNRRGELSPAQRRRLNALRIFFTIMLLLALVECAALARALCNIPLFILLIIAAYYIIGAIQYQSGFYFYGKNEIESIKGIADLYRMDILGELPRTVEGLTRYGKRYEGFTTDKHGPICFVQIENLHFRIDEKQFRALQKDHYYQLYFTKHNPQIISVEELPA